MSETQDGEVRETPINWQNLILQIVDGYRTQGQGIAHGVQKDAIQNSWDARLDKKTGRGWKMRFELLSNKEKTIFVFTDEGTCGLTGRILRPDEMEEDLPEEERWGRFESLAFTKSIQGDIVPLGSRGRGKFIFVGASKDNSLFYDTLRHDGSYRLGTRTVKRTSSPIQAWNNSLARQELGKRSAGLLKPLTNPGTRLVIENPIREIVQSVRGGEFTEFIAETWWEIITKFNAQIFVSVDGRETQVLPPKELVFPEKDTADTKVWVQKNVKVSSGGEEFLMKCLHMVHNKEGVPANLRGVGIQRGGMKVCVIYPRYMPQELADSIYGYVTLDREGEFQLLRDESPEHYAFDFRVGLPKAIRHYVENEIDRFAAAKMGWHADSRAIRRDKQRSAERVALLQINRIAKDVGFGRGLGPGKKRKKVDKGPWKKIRLQLSDIQLPREDDLRVNYGEFIKNISTRVINDSPKDITTKLRLFLRQGDRLAKLFADQDLLIGAKQKSKHFGPFEEKMEQGRYPMKGKVTLVARIISLLPQERGLTLDEEKRSFYLEEDPPPRGLFEDCIPVEIDDPDTGRLMGDDIPGERNGVIVQYNTSHPAYVAVMDNEADAASYLFRLMGLILCRLDLESDKSRLYKKEEVAEEDSVLRGTLRLMSDFNFRYYHRKPTYASSNP